MSHKGFGGVGWGGKLALGLLRSLGDGCMFLLGEHNRVFGREET